jgi:hypothetical protein
MKELLKGENNLLIAEKGRVLKRSRQYSFYIEGQQEPFLTVGEKLSIFGNIGRMLFQTGALATSKLKGIDSTGKHHFTLKLASVFAGLAMKGSKVMDSAGKTLGYLRFKFSTKGQFDIEDESRKTIIQCGYESAYSNENNLKFVRDGNLIGITRDARNMAQIFKSIFQGGGNKWILHFPDMEALTEKDLILMCSAIIHMDVDNDRQ